MKITKRQLRRIIKEEYTKILKESWDAEEPGRIVEDNEVLQFIEDSLGNGYPEDEISSELYPYFSKVDLQTAFDSEDIEGFEMAINIIFRTGMVTE
tara:strand:- start:1549 stop:1836 length:288 start_codon:yes stop_codon:yes gene_type:complete